MCPPFQEVHSSASHNECQGGKTKRPPDEEAEDHERNPGWFSQLVELCCRADNLSGFF
jgi:hypothetical protein